MYEYYYIKTDCYSNTWDTFEIQKFLRAYNFDEEPKGIFNGQDPFINISLMKVKDYDCWSSLDFNKDETNYISIVISSSSKKEAFINEFFEKIEQFLDAKVCSEDS